MRNPALRKVIVAVCVGFVAIITVGATPASAHPLGNFTTNRYSGLLVGPGYGTIDYVVDYAEIPTFQRRTMIDANHNGELETSELDQRATPECAGFQRGLHLTTPSGDVALRRTSQRLRSLPGQGLPTLRAECTYTWTGISSHSTITYRDDNFAALIGWREITAQPDSTRFTNSNVAKNSSSQRLTKYPQGQLHSPLDIRSATVSYVAGGAAAPRTAYNNPITQRYSGLTRWFTDSVQHRRLTLGLALLAIAAALILGAFHALFPGHGKTVMAAYLVGERGSMRHGLVLGGTVALTHTIGVLVLGFVLTATQSFAPESVYPYLGAISGAMFAALGITLLVRALRNRSLGLTHSHSHGDHDHGHNHAHATVINHHDHEHHDLAGSLGHEHHEHEHHEHAGSHGHEHSGAASASSVRGDSPMIKLRSLVALGFAGGLVPTPSAVVVLLGATAIGRAWFGIVLVVFYGVGMSATLIAAGLTLGWARRRYSLHQASERALRYAAAMPILTGVVVTGGGVVLIARALTGA